MWGIHLRAISQEVFVNLIRNMRSEIIHIEKILARFHGADELNWRHSPTIIGT